MENGGDVTEESIFPQSGFGNQNLLMCYLKKKKSDSAVKLGFVLLNNCRILGIYP